MLQRAWQEYQEFQDGTVKPSNTRGVVLSNRDPLFAGRVKVWIPAIHGASPYDEDFNVDPTSLNELPSGITDPTLFKDAKTINALPWAKVLSHNLGPIQDSKTGITASAGCFSTPSVGTEVIVCFENDDPILPIVIGSIIHADEFRYSLPFSLEYIPGSTLSKSLPQVPRNDDKAAVSNDSNYEQDVSKSYYLRTEKGSTLFLSDDVTNASIVLEGTIPYAEPSKLSPEEEINLGVLYPPFPTTASAAFTKRQILSKNRTTPLITPKTYNFIGSDQAASTTVIIRDLQQEMALNTSDAKTKNSEAINLKVEESKAAGRLKKGWPVPGVPHFPGNGRFRDAGAPRKRPHTGVDLLGMDATGNPSGHQPLIAPIDCFPVYCDRDKGNAGAVLLIIGVDGIAHAFFHLNPNSIPQNIRDLCFPYKTALVAKGSILGETGNSGRTRSSHGGDGAHLHWETFPTNGATTGQALWGVRMSLAGHADLHPAMIDPEVWFKYNSDLSASVSEVYAHQLQQTLVNSTIFAAAMETDYSKPAGLEISLVPGKETVTIRHPSGSFIGFDPDGNINIYSCGDINFRANRSITYDVLGAILENSLAKFIRVKTLIKSWSGLSPIQTTKASDPEKMPEFFTRVNQGRTIDMNNALRSTTGNAFIINDANENVSP